MGVADLLAKQRIGAQCTRAHYWRLLVTAASTYQILIRRFERLLSSREFKGRGQKLKCESTAVIGIMPIFIRRRACLKFKARRLCRYHGEGRRRNFAPMRQTPS